MRPEDWTRCQASATAEGVAAGVATGGRGVWVGVGVGCAWPPQADRNKPNKASANRLNRIGRFVTMNLSKWDFLQAGLHGLT